MLTASHNLNLKNKFSVLTTCSSEKGKKTVSRNSFGTQQHAEAHLSNTYKQVGETSKSVMCHCH